MTHKKKKTLKCKVNMKRDWGFWWSTSSILLSSLLSQESSNNELVISERSLKQVSFHDENITKLLVVSFGHFYHYQWIQVHTPVIPFLLNDSLRHKMDVVIPVVVSWSDSAVERMNNVWSPGISLFLSLSLFLCTDTRSGVSYSSVACCCKTRKKSDARSCDL